MWFICDFSFDASFANSERSVSLRESPRNPEPANASVYHPRFARRSRREYYARDHARTNEDFGWFRGFTGRGSNLSRRNPGLFSFPPSMMHLR